MRKLALKSTTGIFSLVLLLALIVSPGCATSSDSTSSGSASPTNQANAAHSATVQGSQNTDLAVKAARMRLTRDGLENPDLASAIKVTPATWPDTCLGLPMGNQCQQTPTSGYVIEVEREAQRYLVHTDENGKLVRLAKSPAQYPRDAFLQWRYTAEGQCRTAVIGDISLLYGTCGEALLDYSVVAAPGFDGLSQPSYWRQTFAPFSAVTVRGTVVFSGTGTVVPSEAERRALAEWASDRYAQASLRYLSADHGLRLNFRETSLELCGGLWVYQNGLAMAWDCQGKKAVGARFLSGGQLEQFYGWVDSGKRFEVARHDGSGNRLNLSLQLAGGNPRETGTPAEIEQMIQFSRDVLASLSGKSG